MGQPDQQTMEVEEKGEGDDGIDDKYDDGVPIDGGWGWVISLCVFMNYTIVLAYNRSISVLFVDVKREFDQSATVVSLLFTIGSLTACVSTIVTSNIIMVRFSVRSITVTAAILNSLVTMLVSQAPNIIVFLLLQIIKGSMFGCLLVCPISLIGYYFKKRRNLALAIANTGFCASFITFPPIAEMLRVEFGVRGCLLIISAIELHLAAVNLLLRSPQSYRKLYLRKRRTEELRLSQTKPLLSPTDLFSKSEVHSRDNVRGCDEELAELSEVEKTVVVEKCTSDCCDKIFMDDKTLSKDLSNVKGHLSHEDEMKFVVAECGSSLYDDIDKQETEIRSSHSLHQQEKEASGVSHEDHRKTKESQVSTLASTSVRKLKNVGDGSLGGSHLSLAAPDIAVYSAASSLSLSKTNADEAERQYDEQLPQTLIEAETNAGKASGIFSCWRKIFDVTVFKSWLFRMMLVYTPLTSAINLLTIYMPVVALDVGVSLRNAAFCMTISGVLDLIVRITIGFVADLKCITKIKMVIGSLLILTIQCHAFRLFIKEDTFIIFAIIVGIFGGFRQNLMVSMITDYVGVDKAAKGYAACTMLTTLFMSSTHPVIGAMFDATGHSLLPLHFLGVCLFIGMVVLSCEPFFACLDKRRMKEQQQGKQS